MGDEQPYTGPRFSRHIAELVGLPLDDPDVIAAIAAAESDDGDCQHGCNGDCVVSGSEVCSFTCHAPQLSEGHQIA